MAGILYGNYPQTMKEPTTQVYKLTHDGEGKYLPYLRRAFISFTFGGKSIENWNLIATISGDRLEKQGTAGFEDLTTSYDIVDGQLYWGTHFTNNSLTLQLATDGIRQVELDEFLHWFAPGNNKELILSEHPNRAIMARISDPPSLSLLPFEEETSITIQDVEYKTKTTLYKGEIELNFVMDEPFWYSKVNLLGKSTNNKGGWSDTWTNANNEEVDVFKDADAIKIIYEDGVPSGQMFSSAPTFLGADIFIDTDFTIVGANSPERTQTTAGNIQVNGVASAAASPESAINDTSLGIGFIGPRIFQDPNHTKGRTLASSRPCYLYYPGTAPSYPIISFSLTPVISDSYISFPVNSYVNNSRPYNTITLECLNSQKFCFTTPSAYTAYNQAIRIFRQVSGVDKTEIRNLIRDGVNHKHARAWAIAVVDAFGNNAFNSSVACTNMRYFLCANNSSNLLSSSFSFNCKTGQSIGKIWVRTFTSSAVPSTNMQNFGNATLLEENVGDMVKSNYLIIEDRNYLNDRGQIAPYASTNEKTKSYSHKITLDSGTLSNFYITYKYMYY